MLPLLRAAAASPRCVSAAAAHSCRRKTLSFCFLLLYLFKKKKKRSLHGGLFPLFYTLFPFFYPLCFRCFAFFPFIFCFFFFFVCEYSLLFRQSQPSFFFFSSFSFFIYTDYCFHHCCLFSNIRDCVSNRLTPPFSFSPFFFSSFVTVGMCPHACRLVCSFFFSWCACCLPLAETSALKTGLASAAAHGFAKRCKCPGARHACACEREISPTWHLWKR